MPGTVQPMEEKCLRPSPDLAEDVFAGSDSPEEGRLVRSLAEGIRAKRYCLPALERITGSSPARPFISRMSPA